MRLAVLQPAYFAGIRALAKAAAADVIIWADTFMFSKHSHNRTRIKTASGPLWLTVPVREQHAPVCEIEIDHPNLDLRAQARSLEVSYQNSPYYFFLADELNALFEQPPLLLNELCRKTFDFLRVKLRLDVVVHPAADLPQAAERTERAVCWLEAAGCSDYIITREEEKLIDRSAVEAHGFKVTVIDCLPPRYHQLFGNFYENLSGLDLLFNEGELSKTIIQNSIKLRGEP